MSFLRHAMQGATGPVGKSHNLFSLLTVSLSALLLSASAWAQSSPTFAWGASSDPTVVGYRLYQGGLSHVYTNVVDVGNGTSYQILGLKTGATYYFAVTAYNSVGLESPPSNELLYTVPTSGGGGTPGTVGPISFAADSGALSTPFAASGGLVSQTVQSTVTTGGRAAYTFTITNAGNYVVSALVNAPNEGANSFFVNMDAEPSDPTMIWDIHPLTTALSSRTVSWRGNGNDTTPQFPTAVFNLTAGTHQLIVRGREPNAQLGTVTVTPYLVLTNCLKLSTGNRSLTGTGVANAQCVLYAASSLTPPMTWTPVATNTADALGRFAFSDLKATNYTRRFYRIQAQ